MQMAVRITSAESIRRAILADALLSAIIDVVEINKTGRPPIALGAAGAVVDLPVIDGLEAIWSIKIIGLNLEEISQVSEALQFLFPGAKVDPGVSGLDAKIFSLVTEQIKSAIKNIKLKQQEQTRIQSIEAAVEYAASLKHGERGREGETGARGPRGERGLTGPQGRPGKDGRDVLAAEVDLNDLRNVFVPDPVVGHVLMWDGSSWVSRYLPQSYKYAGASGAGGGIEEAPQDGNSYVRKNGAWIELLTAIASLTSDAGNFDTGYSVTTGSLNLDAGNF